MSNRVLGVNWLVPWANDCLSGLPWIDKLQFARATPWSHLISEVAQSCLTVCDPIDCSLPGSSVHGIFHAIVLEWIAISFSSGSSRPRDQTRVSHIVDRRFTVWATREVQAQYSLLLPLRDLLIKKSHGSKTEGKRRGWQRMRWLYGITDSMDMSLNKFRR